RYLLSPATRADAFATPALHADMVRLLAGLRSSAAPVIEQFGLPDPTGAALALAKIWTGGAHIGTRDGVWFAADRPAARPRALILAELAGSGMDLGADARALGTVRAGFAALAPGGARLSLGGTAALSLAAEHAIRRDAEFLSLLSALGIAALLVWRFRSPLAIAAATVPLALGIGAAALLVGAIVGEVQGIALGFGMTMLGVGADYPVLLIGHRKPGEAPAATLARIGRAFALAVATALLGLSGMIFAGFPVIAQLGLFALIGLLVAALATWLLLARLIVAAELAPRNFGDPRLLARIEKWRRLRPAGIALTALAGLYLLLHGGPHAARDFAALSPVPRAALAADVALRAEIGAPDAGQLGLIEAADAEAVLRKEEALAPVLAALRRRGAIAGAEYAAKLLPSRATQRARRSALPDDPTLAQRLEEAAAGLDFRPEAFAAFRADVARARTMHPLGPQDFAAPALAARLAPLLFRRGAHWYGLIAPTGVVDPAVVAGKLREAGVLYVDVAAETARIVGASTAGALRALAWGGLAALAVLILGLRDARQVIAVAGSVLAALLVSVAALAALGMRVSLLQIVALQLAAGVGLDYALFFARRQLDAEERARTLRTLLLCNAMTLLTFGLLATAATPLLRQIGQTVVIGAGAAIIMAFLFAGPMPARERDANDAR
ncbi:MAG: MMPL family transporter, partial [Rhodospirillales bacterium]|nr:MMPL family transporter [Rhodospirillales bacterium]